MLIDCLNCQATVDARECGHADRMFEDESGRRGGSRFFLCPSCTKPLLAEVRFRGEDGPDEYWSEPERLYPPDKLDPLDLFDMPREVRLALREAERCMFGKAYTASVVMSVQAIEGLCRAFDTQKTKLLDRLKELKQQEIIDGKLYLWACELWTHRNIAAHPTGAKFSRMDAQDIFDFALAICEYVFVLTVQFDRFQERVKKAGQ